MAHALIVLTPSEKQHMLMALQSYVQAAHLLQDYLEGDKRYYEKQTLDRLVAALHYPDAPYVLREYYEE